MGSRAADAMKSSRQGMSQQARAGVLGLESSTPECAADHLTDRGRTEAAPRRSLRDEERARLARWLSVA